jgi:hypothetical protein
MGSWRVYNPYNNKAATNVASIEYEIRRNSMGKFKVVLQSQSQYERNKWVKGYGKENLLFIKRGSRIVFKGFIENISPSGPDGRDLILEGRSLEVLLFLNAVSPTSFKTGGTTPNIRTNQDSKQLVTYLIDTFSTNSTTDVTGRLTYTASSLTASSSVYSMRFGNESLLSAMMRIVDQTDQDFWVDYDSSNETFVIYLGTQGGGDSNNPLQTFKDGRGMDASISDEGLRDTVNRVRVVGKGDGFNQVTLVVPFWNPHKSTNKNTCTGKDDPDRVCVPTRSIAEGAPVDCTGTSGANPGCVHANATQSQSDNGIIEYVLSDPSIDNVELARTRAIAFLDKYYDSQRVVEVSVTDPNVNINVGDWVRINNKQINIVVRITGIVHKMSSFGLVETMRVSVNRQFEDAADEINIQKRNVEITQGHESGSTNIFTVNAADNTEGSTYPLVMKFYLPTDVKLVNDAKLSYNIGSFRDYSSTTAAGGSASINFNGINTAGSTVSALGSTWTNIGSTFTPNTDHASFWFHFSFSTGAADFKHNHTQNSHKHTLNQHRHVENTDPSYTQYALTDFTTPPDSNSTTATNQSEKPTNDFVDVRLYNSTDGEYYPDSNGISLDHMGSSWGDIFVPKNLNGKTLQLQAKRASQSADYTFYWQYFGVAEHTHTNDYGTQEDTWSSTDKHTHIKINGTERTAELLTDLHGPTNDASDQTDLDISTYMNKGATNTVEMWTENDTTNTAARSRIRADIFVRCYIESL